MKNDIIYIPQGIKVGKSCYLFLQETIVIMNFYKTTFRVKFWMGIVFDIPN